MRIIYVCNEYPPVPCGGIGIFTKQIAEYLAASGHQVRIIGYWDNPVDSEETINGVIITRLHKRGFNSSRLGKVLQEFRIRIQLSTRLKKLAKSFKPDIIEIHDWSGPIIFKPPNTITIVRLHGSHKANNWYMGTKESMLTSFFERKELSIADFIVGVSKQVNEITSKTFKIKINPPVIYNPIDTKMFKDLGFNRDKNKLLVVGRMHYYKGLDLLFQALNIVFEKNDKVYLEMICCVIESEKKKLLAILEEPYQKRIRFLGRKEHSELPAYYSSANLLLFPSRADALGIVPLESMACGTPVLMSDRSGSKEIIDDGVNGFLINVFEKELFAHKILTLLENQSRIDSIRENARKTIENKFSINKIMEKNLNFYLSNIESSRYDL